MKQASDTFQHVLTNTIVRISLVNDDHGNALAAYRGP
jgi:hypothetical protein